MRALIIAVAAALLLPAAASASSISYKGDSSARPARRGAKDQRDREAR
jgi:hypothetical protein